jgi:predicted acylesterase/phospholipase RssA
MRILSLDGGIAVALHLRRLRRLEALAPGFLAGVDLFVGTSDGALAAMFLASRIGPDHGDNLRAVDAAADFFHDVLGVFRVTPATALRFASGRGPRALAEAQRRVFAAHLGDETLGSLAARGRRVLVLAIDRSTWKRCVFANLDPPADPSRSLVDLALACSAFPVVLPAHRSEADGRAYLDAALVTNNPSLVAVREALATAGGAVTLLSLGATESAEQRSEGPAPGVLGWLPPALDRLGFQGWGQLLARMVYLPDFLIQGSVDIVDLQCAELLGPRYHRARAVIPEIDWLASIALPPERLRRRIDAAAEADAAHDGAAVRWVRERWLVPAEGAGAAAG